MGFKTIENNFLWTIQSIRIYEAPGYTLYHQSVVDAVMALEPVGMYFQDI